MDQVFLRNFLIFVVILAVCASALSYRLVSGEKEIGHSDDLIVSTQKVITEAEQLSTNIEGMIANQRGYILTGEEAFYEKYDEKKANVSNNIANLSDLTDGNKSQQSRLDEIRSYYVEFAKILDERAKIVTPLENSNFINDVEMINNIKENIMRVNTDMLNEEYNLLNQRFQALEDKKSGYFNSLLIGIIFGSILLLLFNGFLLRAQRKRSLAEKSLKSIEERLLLAIEGTQDGIFDWDIEKDEVFFSTQFFEQLGYDKKGYKGSTEDFAELLHPEEYERVWDHIQRYLAGELSEYAQEFRMKHQSGRWVWIQSRAKALFDKNGKAYRMVGAHSDITHLKQAQEKLLREKEIAQNANRAKSDFLAHMSHEIRTPLTAISGIGEILQKQSLELTDKQAQLVKTLNNSTLSLKELINDILDFSKIEGGELELDEKNFHLDEVFEETISMMAFKAAEKGISFVFDYDGIKDTDFYGDPMRIRQIIVNLVSNAIKFTDTGGVTIKAEFEDRNNHDYLRIDISDTGIGISPDDFDLIFERFKQADSSVSRKFGGTGLGLPISRNLARLMGGDVFLSSEIGQGSTFSILLPVKVEMSGKSGKMEHRQNNKKLTDQLKASVTGDNKALIVEDYEGNVVVISYIMDEIGLNYDVAKTGLEAVEQWENNHYDLILMDIQMPEMDGFTATRKIRAAEQQNEAQPVPIIGMTAHALVGDKDKCLEAGMTAYLPKPLVEADLKKAILQNLEIKKAA